MTKKWYKPTGTILSVADAFEQGINQKKQMLDGSPVVRMKLDQLLYQFTH
jgi:hypothetical protein